MSRKPASAKKRAKADRKGSRQSSPPSGIMRMAARGAFAFTVGRLLAAIAEAAMASVETGDTTPAYTFYIVPLAYFAGGAAAMTILAWKRLPAATLLRAAFGFGMGFWILFYGTYAFAHVAASNAANLVAHAAGFAIIFAIAFGLAMLALDWKLVPLGTLAFALPAALSGALYFYLPTQAALPVTLGVLVLPLALGGALFGALFAWTRRSAKA